MRRRTLFGEPIPPLNKEGEAGDYVFYNHERSGLEVVHKSSWTAAKYPSSGYTPIGVVVIPTSHGVLKYGSEYQCGIISLVDMTSSNPQKGATSATSTRKHMYVLWRQWYRHFNFDELSTYCTSN